MPLTLGPGRVDVSATASLQRMRLKSRSKGDFKGAIIQAGFHAKKQGKTFFGYSGNSYGHAVWRVTDKKGDYLSSINNTGSKVFSVSPDLTVTFYDVKQPKLSTVTKEIQPMSLRKQLIKLAHDNPELRGDILPLLEEQPKTASTKEASFGSNILRDRVDMSKFRQAKKVAKEGGWDKVLMDVVQELTKQLQPPDNVERALNRFSNMLRGSMDEGMLRNQAFKVADELKLRLPHGIFASEDDDNT